MNILLLAGSPSTPARSTCLLHHVGERLALFGHRYVKLHDCDLPEQALVHSDNCCTGFAWQRCCTQASALTETVSGG
jgi:NAD(P)H-dependent FMN reductase